jgi:hypothetical protein
MKRTLIRYKTKPETTEENQRLIENVFRELQTKSVDGFRYVGSGVRISPAPPDSP